MESYILLLLLAVPGSFTIDCDLNSDTIQCSTGEICKNDLCTTARECSTGADCSGEPGTYCVADYCQPASCTARGQCVHGHVCSHDVNRMCVYPVYLASKENSRVVLNFSEPGSVNSYEEISWYKDTTSGADRLVYVHPAITGGKALYYGDYCPGSSPCETSHKGELNVATGEFTIFSAQLTDEGYYFYKFYSPGEADTGRKYQIQLNVYEYNQCNGSAHCNESQICVNNYCEIATHCDTNADCSAKPNTSCIADYCQLEACTSAGQCVHGQICSHDLERICVYPVWVQVVPGSELTLSILEPAVPGTYEEITWYKGSRGGTVAMYHPDLTGGNILYFGDFCPSGEDNCETSEKGELNTQTGDLIVYRVNETDEDYYYYRFSAPSVGGLDTGNKYETQLDICDDVVTICGPLDRIFEARLLPEFNPEWSMLESVEAFEKSFTEGVKGHPACDGEDVVTKLMEIFKEWIRKN